MPESSFRRLHHGGEKWNVCAVMTMKRRQFLKITIPVALSGTASAQAKEKPAVTFGVIADPQYVDAPVRGSRHYRASVKKLNAAVLEMNRHQLDFVVTLGDVIDRNIASFETMMPIYEKLKAPRRFVLGNHDCEVADEDKQHILSSLKMEKSYSSETRGDWQFIYLDGTDVSTYRHPKDSEETKYAKELLEKLQAEKLPQAQPWNGAIGDVQLAWFKTELEKAKQGQRRVIVMNHFPVFPADAHNLWNDTAVVELISKSPNVLAYMNGHNHSGHYAVHQGCHFLNFKGMVETANQSAFAIVRCYADRIEVDGFETEPDRRLQ
ncbi:phosphatase [Oceaniferula spumae]|uniref:Phosphatase n=1 Tax=Oceaniferula spumae TaxID=2979115 RepID=A0AAT9FSH0_9BACT